MLKHTQNGIEKQAKALQLQDQLRNFVGDGLGELNRRIDRRLVRTFLGLLMAILCHRHRQHGMLLSELGGFLLGPERCQAGTKRIARLLHSDKWSAEWIEHWLWRQGDQRVEELQAGGERPLILWDESVLEKSESLAAERLCAVRSSKAVRLKRIKPGYFNPPGGRPIFVPGFNWLQVLVLGRQGPPRVAHFAWWTTRGEHQTTKRELEKQVLDQIDRRWGKEVVHIWDRGFAGQPWLTLAFIHAARFVMRWPKNYRLLDAQGQTRQPGQISKAKRSWEQRLLWDARRRCQRKVGVIAFPVADVQHQQPLWLVVARRKNQSPWYLLTSEPIRNPTDAWRVVLDYARRWQIEMTIRYAKAELAFESPRLLAWQSRKKLLLMATLCYAFLLSLLQVELSPLRNWLLRTFCHRNGKRSRVTPAPLYRLRFAISLFWLRHPPPFLSLL